MTYRAHYTYGPQRHNWRTWEERRRGAPHPSTKSEIIGLAAWVPR